MNSNFEKRLGETIFFYVKNLWFIKKLQLWTFTSTIKGYTLPPPHTKNENNWYIGNMVNFINIWMKFWKPTSSWKLIRHPSWKFFAPVNSSGRGVPPSRFGKSTHISMISNSVTHVQSYTNSAIAGNFAWSPTSSHRALIPSHRMTSARSPTSLPQMQTSPYRAPMSSHRAPISSHRMTSVSWCFTMF